ncbi:MAG TPA: SLBB domain-containing protein [Pyrinomonadaceae bacterium]|jgi:polysaccharide export outer membrane protein|nr:SLBB domain-containing protein [Pyrinomonadaceae bacterium]
MKFKSLLSALALCLAASAAFGQDSSSGSQTAAAGVTVSPMPGGALDSVGIKKYLLGPGDVLDLRVYDEPQLSGQLVVNDEGKLEVPFIEEPIPALCRTDREIKKDIVTALARLIKKPQVSLRVAEMKSRPAAVVFGAVRSPSRVDMKKRARLLELLALTGGVTEQAGGNVQIFHTEALMCPEPEDELAKPIDVYTPTDATQVAYEIYSLPDLKNGKPEANPIVRPGDIIIVQEAQPVYLTGAVKSPQGLYLRDGMQLKQAIAMVGGLAKEAKASQIVIWRRKKGTSEPEKLVVNYNDIRKEKTQDIALQPYDIVEVPDGSGGVKGVFKGILMGGLTNAGTSTFSSLPLRVLY